MNNKARDDITVALAAMEKPNTKNSITSARLSFYAEMVFKNQDKISWHSSQSFLVRKNIDFVIWAGAVFFGAWAGIYYRETGSKAVCGWEHIDEAYGNPTWKCPDGYDTWYAKLGGYGSFLANIWYYVAANYFLIDFISMLIAEHPNNIRLLTVERIAFFALFMLISIAPTVAAVELANQYTDPWYSPWVSIPNLWLMNILSLYNFKSELLAKWWSHGQTYLQTPGLSKMQANHIANRQLFRFERAIDEQIRLLETSDITIAADSYELTRCELERYHNVALADPGHVEDGYQSLRSSAMVEARTFSEQHIRSKRYESTGVKPVKRESLRTVTEPGKAMSAADPARKHWHEEQKELTRAYNKWFHALGHDDELSVRSRRGRAKSWIPEPRLSDEGVSPVAAPLISEVQKQTLFGGVSAVRPRAFSFAAVTEKRPTIHSNIKSTAVCITLRGQDQRWRANTHMFSADKIAKIVSDGDVTQIDALLKAGVLKRVPSNLELNNPDLGHLELNRNLFEPRNAGV